ncbi:transporter [Alishewanella sp. WH16-1]|uniref:BON domain-containing protein n=1 Tax=Alishewanella sp. WH16-1 TaxID=1651088 RepID=UPI00070F3CEC|nr:BON domain-containing protein [Alishewanella sp. WH16-1]KRS22077.1 transporter [Alishewanella sp. WH16-1]
MQTMKRSFITLGVVLAGSLALVNCDPGPNTQPGPIDLTVTTEDGSGDDARITTAVHTMLLADIELKHLTIAVETRKGDVKLSGDVETEAQREHTGRIVAATSGVHAVNNQLKVKK